MPPRSRTLAERFWSHVDKGDGAGCWLWTAGVWGEAGYGRIRLGGKGSPRADAHRVSWELAYGPIPGPSGRAGLWVLHHCDNHRCVRPEHLFLGTHADNMADMVAKGRWAGGHPRHERCLRGHDLSVTRTPNGCSTCRAIRLVRYKEAARARETAA